MAYADNRMSKSRMSAIFIVAVLHALLGYALITGLAYNVVKKVAADLKTFNVEEEPPPPEEKPPPPPPDTPQTPPPIVAPPPIIRTNTPPPAITTQPVVMERPVITMKADPVPERRSCPDGSTVEASRPCPTPPVRKVEPARAKANLAGLISDEDYPASALRSEEQGSVRVTLQIGTNGRVTGCSVAKSSGSSSLDNTTCRLLTSRGRFTPARDSNGNPTTDTVTSPNIVWRIAE